MSCQIYAKASEGPWSRCGTQFCAKMAFFFAVLFLFLFLWMWQVGASEAGSGQKRGHRWAREGAPEPIGNREWLLIHCTLV